MTRHLPPIIYATAACAAGSFLGARPDDVFDEDAGRNARRARIVALVALARVYPSCGLHIHATCMGLRRWARVELSNLRRAEQSLWFREEDVSAVCEALSRLTSGKPWGDHAAKPSPIPREVLATRFVPRKGRVVAPRATDAPPMLPRPARRVSLTAAFFGDPPAGRREALASMASEDYSAGFDSDGHKFTAMKYRQRMREKRDCHE